jgi:hypothetical protein
MSPRDPRLVLAIYLQKRGFAFVLFEARLAAVDWGVQEVRDKNRNALCLGRIESIFEFRKPDVLVLQDTLKNDAHRAPRIQELNASVAELAAQRGILVRIYSRAQVLGYFARHGAATKQSIAETIAKQIPAVSLYLPPPRKAWGVEHPRMGIFEAAALAWMFFESSEGNRLAA